MKKFINEQANVYASYHNLNIKVVVDNEYMLYLKKDIYTIRIG